MSRIQVRRDTSANWKTINPVLAAGEWGYELDTKKVKIGDGSSPWNNLAYKGEGGGGSGDVTLAGNNIFTGTNTFTNTIQISNTNEYFNFIRYEYPIAFQKTVDINGDTSSSNGAILNYRVFLGNNYLRDTIYTKSGEEQTKYYAGYHKGNLELGQGFKFEYPQAHIVSETFEYDTPRNVAVLKLDPEGFVAFCQENAEAIKAALGIS